MNLAEPLRSSRPVSSLLITIAAFALYGGTLRGYFPVDDFRLRVALLQFLHHALVWFVRRVMVASLWGYTLPESPALLAENVRRGTRGRHPRSSSYGLSALLWRPAADMLAL
jgi:hypothetical protein